MIGDEVIQAAIIAKLKELAPFGAVQANEIREVEWQGDAFTYPNIRFDLDENEFAFDEQGRCNLQYIEFSVFVFSEQRSSKEASQIKTLLLNALVGKGITNQTYQVRFSPLRLLDNVRTFREDERTWRSQVRFQTRVSGI